MISIRWRVFRPMWLLLRIEALEYLKRGRGVIIGQLLDRRTDLSDLILRLLSSTSVLLTKSILCSVRQLP